MRLIKKLLWIIFLLALALGLIMLGYYFAMTKDVTLDPEKLILSEKTITLYDKNQEQIHGLSVSFEQTVNVENLSKNTIHAFVDTEDKRFFSHNGFDYKRIIKAAWNNLKSRSFKEGASTISQQLIKNTHLSQEKTLKRKLQEWKLTKELERRYSKEEILEKYLNSIYFGHNCFGLYSASDFYFGKTPSELNVGEAAILAGLVKSPNNYSPFKNPNKCKTRKENVLNAMLQNGSIDQAEKSRAQLESLPSSPNISSRENGYLHFVFDELTELSEKQDFTIGGNVEIYTYFDKALQAEIEENSQNLQTDKSIIVLDLETNGFKAAYSNIGNITRLPGSLIKPLAVYAPALEEDLISPATPILDEPVNYSGYQPENYDKTYRGYVSIRECIEKSLNIPAVKVLSSLSVKKSAEYLKKMGLRVPDNDLSLALALGGIKEGFTLSDLVHAYSIFPKNGNLSTIGFIQKIKINGTTVYEKKDYSTRIFDSSSSYLMTDMLRTTAQYGTAKKLRSLPFDIAAKTGTVGTENGNTDAYALSFTTKDCIGVWLGNRDNSIIEEIGGGTPCSLLLNINEFLYKNQTPNNFVAPSTVKKVALDKKTYYDTHNMQLADTISPIEYQFSELFKTTQIPTKQSTFFSNPSIPVPLIRLQNDKVSIVFDERFPTCYQYKIERSNYVTHNNYVSRNTLYLGEYLPEFIDTTIEENKNYLYTITPLYKNNTGITVQLPIITTKESPDNSKILNEEWWNY